MKKFVAVLATAVLGLGMVTACSQNDIGDAVDRDQWIEDVVAATYDTTAHFAVTVDSKAAGQSATMSMEGDMDSTDPDNPKFSIRTDMGARGSYDMIIVDGSTYMRQGHGSYEKVTNADTSEMLSQLNPAAELEKQRATITRVGRVGTETVAGVSTTHYVVTVDATKMKEGVAPGKVVGDTIQYNYWLDDKMRMIKVSASVKVKIGSETGSVATEVVFTNHGKPVTITAPY